MQVNISARHGHLSPGTQEKISEKVERLSKFHDRVTSIKVTVDLEHRENPSVEVLVKVEHSDEFVSNESGPNALTALDSALHKVETQLKKHHDKQTGHRATGHKHLDT